MSKPNIEFQYPDPPSIVMVIGSLQGGGSERVMSDMANYWSNKRWKVTLVTWTGSEVTDFYKLDSDVDRVWLDDHAPNNSILDKLRLNILRIFKLRRLFIELKPNVVLSFIHISNVITILSGIGLKVRIVVSERMQPAVDPTIPKFWKVLRRILYSFSDEVVVQTKYADQWIRRYCHKKAIVIPNALRPLPKIMSERKKIIVAIGRLSHQKGFDLLLKAFTLIADDFEDWNVVIIGDGVERENLLRLRYDLVLTKRVELISQVQNIESWMARAGLVVQPSRYEGFPNVLLESMGMGAAVISADCPSGPSDLIKNGMNGRLVPVENRDVLAQVMAELMSQPETRIRLGREALKVGHHYRQDLIMLQWESCLLPGFNNILINN